MNIWKNSLLKVLTDCKFTLIQELDAKVVRLFWLYVSPQSKFNALHLYKAQIIHRICEYYAVEVSEVQAPTDQEPILWRLLTTHEVMSIEKALQIIQWYCWRWRIEQLFTTLKLAGLDIESTQLESPDAIKKLTVLALSVAVRTLQMVEGRETPNISASMAFSDMCNYNAYPILNRPCKAIL